MNQTFEFGRLRSPGDTALACVVVIAVVGWLVWMQRTDRGMPSSAARWWLGGLRLALALVAWLVWLEPRTRALSEIVAKPEIALLVDRSASMATTDGGSAGPSRFARLKAELRPHVVASRDRFDWRAYSFGASVQPTDLDAWPNLAATDDASRIADAIGETLASSAGRRLAGIVVATDGRQTSGGSLAEIGQAARANVPIHAVVVGADRAKPSARITQFRMPAKAFVGDPLNAAAELAATELAGKPATLEIVANAGKNKIAIRKQALALPADAAPLPLALSLPPLPAGSWDVVATLTFDGGTHTRHATVDSLARKTKVLLAASGPSHEYQFVRNLLARDTTCQLSLHLQTASADSFQAGKELLAELPADRRRLFEYDALVALDVDWQRVPLATRELLAEWVGRQAAGILLAAGPAYAEALPTLAGEFGNLQPVQPADDEKPPATTIAPLEITDAGTQSSVLRLADEAAQSQALWAAFSGWYAPFPAKARTSATVLATIQPPGAAKQTPALARAYFGSGRVWYVGSCETWRLRRQGEGSHERLWTQLVRDLAAGRLLRESGRGQFLQEQESYPLGRDIALRAMLFDETFRPLTTPRVRLSAIQGQERRDGFLDAVADRPGEYRGNLIAPVEGAWRVAAALPDGVSIEHSVRVEATGVELVDTRADRAALAALVGPSGGAVHELADAADLPSWFAAQATREIRQGPPRPLWQSGYVLCLLIALAATEWIVRKRLDLP